MLPPLMRRFPSPSRSSTGAFSHSLISHKDLGEGRTEGALRFPGILVRTALLPKEREPVPGCEPIGEKCQACQDKGQRRSGARQSPAMDGGVQPTEQSTAWLVSLFLLWNTRPGVQGS